MEHKQGSSSQGRPPGSRRRRRRRRRRSAGAGPGPKPAANRRPPNGGEARERAPRPPAAAHREPPEPDPVRAPAPAAAAAEPGDPSGCPVCTEPVRDLYTAIAYGERKAPAHFDCIVALLGEREELEEGTRVCYLGGGSFGIVQAHAGAREGDRAGMPWVRKRIEVEERDAAPAWREELRLPLPERRPPSVERRPNVTTSEAAPCK